MIDDEQCTLEQGGFQGFAWTSDEETSPADDGAKAAGAKKATASTGAKRLASVIARACAHSRPVGLLKFGEQGAGDVALAQYVEDSLLPAHTVYSEGSFWVYTGMRWKIIPHNQLEGLVEQINRKEYIAEGGQPPKRLSLGDRRVQAIINRLRSRLSRGREDFFNASTTTCPGGAMGT